jgi:multidrug efflux pump subunit AcrA (membrane-fusion protein)
VQTYKNSLEQILDQYNQELAEINRVQSAFTAPFDRDRDIALVDAGRVLEDAGRHLQAEYAQDVDDIDGKARDCLLRRKAALATLSEAAELGQFFEEENRRMLRELEEVNHRA